MSFGKMLVAVFGLIGFARKVSCITLRSSLCDLCVPLCPLR